uniref:DUF834 domain-containing protein n=1 Tax=Setaria viridis TaxID=4556 RepID=A0A4U6W1V8_SETVI|nr:hypothetical protein SEVIR_2G410000v2 [Setaria viridis]
MEWVMWEGDKKHTGEQGIVGKTTDAVAASGGDAMERRGDEIRRGVGAGRSALQPTGRVVHWWRWRVRSTCDANSAVHEAPAGRRQQGHPVPGPQDRVSPLHLTVWLC